VGPDNLRREFKGPRFGQLFSNLIANKDELLSLTAVSEAFDYAIWLTGGSLELFSAQPTFLGNRVRCRTNCKL